MEYVYYIMKNIIKIVEKIEQQILYLLARQLSCRNKSLKYVNINDELEFQRIPDYLADKLTKGIRVNNYYSAGREINFITEAHEIEVNVIYKQRSLIKHMSCQATSGIDVYLDINSENIWTGCISPQNNVQMLVKTTIKMGVGKKKVKFFLPAFAEINDIYIGVKPEYNVCCFKEMYKETIVFYGSSITQGCAASRPALSFVNILGRKLNKKVLNFGFSESAKGETDLIEYIASMKAGIYILEYDHNATLEELKNSHRKVYEIIRNKNKNSLIILMSRFSGGISIGLEEEKERINIIEQTYLFALEQGDINIELIKGNSLSVNKKELLFADDRHPNDYGMILIANMLYQVIKRRGL